MVRAGLQGDMGSGTYQRMADGASFAQGHDFGVRAACLLGVSLADQFAVAIDEDAADVWVGIGETK